MQELDIFPPFDIEFIYLHPCHFEKQIHTIISMGNSGIRAVYQTELSNSATGKLVTKLHFFENRCSIHCLQPSGTARKPVCSKLTASNMSE